MRGYLSEFERSIRGSHSSVHQGLRNEILDEKVLLRRSREFWLRIRRVGKVELLEANNNR